MNKKELTRRVFSKLARKGKEEAVSFLKKFKNDHGLADEKEIEKEISYGDQKTLRKIYEDALPRHEWEEGDTSSEEIKEKKDWEKSDFKQLYSYGTNKYGFELDGKRIEVLGNNVTIK